MLCPMPILPRPPGPTSPPSPPPTTPLFPHASGKWAKKVKGNTTPRKTRCPRPETEGLTVKELANKFLNHKKELLDEGRLSPRTWAEHKETTDLLVSGFSKGRLVEDLGPDDFASLRRGMAKRRGRCGSATRSSASAPCSSSPSLTA